MKFLYLLISLTAMNASADTLLPDSGDTTMDAIAERSSVEPEKSVSSPSQIYVDLHIGYPRPRYRMLNTPVTLENRRDPIDLHRFHTAIERIQKRERR